MRACNHALAPPLTKTRLLRFGSGRYWTERKCPGAIGAPVPSCKPRNKLPLMTLLETPVDDPARHGSRRDLAPGLRGITAASYLAQARRLDPRRKPRRIIDHPCGAVEGKIQLDGLAPDDEGFGLLDGLADAIPVDEKGVDEKASIVATTNGLFEAGLGRIRRRGGTRSCCRGICERALRSDEVYQQALSTDTKRSSPTHEMPLARRCFAAQAPRARQFREPVKQAQSLVAVRP